MFTKELRVAGLQAKSVRPSKILVGNQYQGNFRTPFIDTFLSYSLRLSKRSPCLKMKYFDITRKGKLSMIKYHKSAFTDDFGAIRLEARERYRIIVYRCLSETQRQSAT